MTVAAVFVPSPPLLLPEYVGLVDPGAELRSRCVTALSDALSSWRGGPGRVVIVTGRSATGDPLLKPLGVRVGRHLLSLAGWEGPIDALVVPAEGALDLTAAWGRPMPPPAAGALAGQTNPGDAALLVVVGDGSARRSEKAPGHLDERSFAMDETILAALASADTAALLALDPETADALMVTGRAALQAAAYRLGATRLDGGEVTWSGDPYGVMYWVARWRMA